MTNKRVDNKNCAVFLGECCNKDDTGCGNCMESSQMTNNQLTDDGLSLLISKLDKALSECINHGFTDSAEEYADMVNALRELQEHRKCAVEPIYQLFDMGWYDTDKQTYDSVTGAGCAGRIVYAAPKSLSEEERAELQEHRKAIAGGKFTKFTHALFGDMVAVDGEPLAIECVINTLNAMQAELQEHRKADQALDADLLHTAASAIEDLLTEKDRSGAHVWHDVPMRLRKAAGELQEHRKAETADREMLKQLARIMSGSDTPGEIRSLTVTAQSLVERCKALSSKPSVAPVAIYDRKRGGFSVVMQTMMEVIDERDDLQIPGDIVLFATRHGGNKS